MSESYEQHQAKAGRVTELKAQIVQAKSDLAKISRLRPAANQHAKTAVMADKLVSQKLNFIEVATDTIKAIEEGK